MRDAIYIGPDPYLKGGYASVVPNLETGGLHVLFHPRSKRPDKNTSLEIAATWPKYPRAYFALLERN